MAEVSDSDNTLIPADRPRFIVLRNRSAGTPFAWLAASDNFRNLLLDSVTTNIEGSNFSNSSSILDSTNSRSPTDNCIVEPEDAETSSTVTLTDRFGESGKRTGVLGAHITVLLIQITPVR